MARSIAVGAHFGLLSSSVTAPISDLSKPRSAIEQKDQNLFLYAGMLISIYYLTVKLMIDTLFNTFQ